MKIILQNCNITWLDHICPIQGKEGNRVTRLQGNKVTR